MTRDDPTDREAMRRRFLAILAPTLYAAVSIAAFGRGVLRDPTNSIVGDDGADKTIFLWGFAWLPRALGRGEDPISTHEIWAPVGTDLAWVNWTPGAALVAWPVTTLAGVVPGYNLLALLAPPLAAWTAFLFLRELCGRSDVALLGGMTFGFSSFVTVHTIGHLNLTACFLVPLCALLGLRRFRGRLSRVRYVGFLAAAIVGQMLISTELAVTLVLFGVLVALAAWTQLSEAGRRAMRTLSIDSGLAVALAAVVTAPLLVHALVIAGTEAQPERSAFRASTDVANLVVPTRRTMLRPPGSDHIVDHFTAGGAERVGYLGIPILIAAVGLALSSKGRTALGRTVLIAFGVALLAAFGPRLRMAGVTLAPGPWAVPAHLPVLDGIKPARVMVYAALAAAAALCLWVADRPTSRGRWAVAALAVVCLLPTMRTSLWTAKVPRPVFFAGGASAAAIPRGATVVVLPYGGSGWSMLWQAEDSFRYHLVGGHIGKRVTAAESGWEDVHRALVGRGTVSTKRFRSFLSAHRVDLVIVTPGTPPRVVDLVESLDLPVESRDDALVYRSSRAIVKS
jgi:dolichyl-phosphate beta-glucosyltransferase